MRTPVFTGSCPALATPFDQNGNINYDAFGKLIDARSPPAWMRSACAVPPASQPPCPSGSTSPRWNSASSGWTTGSKSSPARAATTPPPPVYLSQHAQDSGADACLLVTPYYNKASQTGSSSTMSTSRSASSCHDPLQRAQPHRSLLYRRVLQGAGSESQDQRREGASATFSLLAPHPVPLPR